MMGKELEWRVHTPNLLQEIGNNPQCVILVKPLQILGILLSDVGERAAELNDDKLNKLMIQLGIYSIADPGSPDYDPKVVDKYMKMFPPKSGKDGK